MDDIYKYILKNSTLNDLIEACLENKNIAIIISNYEIEDVLIYLKNYILNNITIEELKKRVNAVSINHTIDMVKIKKFNILNREISNNKKKIMEIFLSFIKKDNEGKSLNDLYSITKKSLEFKDKEFKYFCILNKFKLFTDNNKEAIIENIQKLFEGEYINLFIKYKKFNGNKKFNIINKELTNEDIVKVKLKMSGILNNTFAFIPPIYYNKYTSDFERENIYYKNYNENQLLEVVKRINYKHNKKMLDKIQLDEIVPSNRKYPYIDFKPDRMPGNEILQVKNISKTVNGERILNNVSFTVKPNDKIAIVADNENAKTVLFQIIAGEMEPDEGKIIWGTTITNNYFPKDNNYLFQSDLSITDWLRQYSKDPDETYVRSFLGRMLFSGEEALKAVNVLSGGEKVRCVLAKMMLSGANFLIMDEPTNHLDMESITALNDGMVKFPGNMIFTSHDHQLMQTVANRIIDIKENEVIDREVSYDEYLGIE